MFLYREGVCQEYYIEELWDAVTGLICWYFVRLSVLVLTMGFYSTFPPTIRVNDSLMSKIL